MYRIILACLILLTTSSAALSEGIINDDGTIREMCVRIKEKGTVVYYKGNLFNTNYQRDGDNGTVIIEDIIGVESESSTDNIYRKICEKYKYTTGQYTVSINYGGQLKTYQGIYSYRPWVDIVL